MSRHSKEISSRFQAQIMLDREVATKGAVVAGVLVATKHPFLECLYHL